MTAADLDEDALAPDAATPAEGVASGSSFYLAMRLLPRRRREAMYAIYGFCRAVDDIADGTGLTAAARTAALGRWRETVAALCAGRPIADPIPGLAAATRDFGLRREDFEAVIDGMAMDAAGPIQAPDWATLDLYCDCVASAVGRLSVRVFGMAEEPGRQLAHHLGRALQLTNILRDLDEDAGLGRLYLPREALEAAGMSDLAPPAVLAHPRLDEACRAVAARASGHFAESRRIMAAAPRQAVKAPRLMASAYAPVLERMEAQGWAPPRTRVSVNKAKLLLAVLRYGIV
ncbi:MAG TPA: presqualene diphosphate synthase HpnD [Hyphomicrobiales bacterium]|nr:presqualene diphosphate synthase HpnD [Hyphomicrobiales bacterium]